MKAYRFALTLALPVFALQACASHQPSKEVTAQMTRTEVVIQQADRSGVAVNSLPELQAAKDKYAKAKTALEKKSAEGDHEALTLAKQAEVDAQFATAKAQSATQQTAAADAQKGVNDLRKETDHNAAAPATTTP
ncbi:MAG TPA: DUF4398 domain-containing protein [Steroidobacteraceae bacterium]|nr:DUF4398 domain-containing protein [Steroidobacteraceae bacterium]